MAVNATMRGVVWEGQPYNVTVMDLPIPTLQAGTDALVRITTAAICGTDLHTYHGVYGSTYAPWGMGHEAIGVITEIGNSVASLGVGDRVVIPDMPDDGYLNMEPQTEVLAFGLGANYGTTGGCQAEYVRVPFADNSLITLPTTNSSTNSSHELDYLFTSDIFATGWTALDFAGFEPGDTVAVFGAGPVGLLSAYSAILRGASKVYSVDSVPSRLQKAASIGAIPISLNESDPVEQILSYEPLGVTRSVDCVGFEAVNSNLELQENVVIMNMINVTSTGGGIGQVGVFSTQVNSTGAPRGSTLSSNIEFPMTSFFNKGLTFRAGGVDPKAIASELVDLIASGRAEPSFIISSEIDIEDAPEYYARFDEHLETKVVIRFP
ncbi:MAG: hypothetical protein M1834_008936 [Cirrosporium novae-zelandiae]|nr:MAG: hypothetical protein M1834_008936 [Cirrosporium novae-zelandiae]